MTINAGPRRERGGGGARVVDLHLHTTYGSLDSSLTSDELLRAAPSAGLDGFVITEHGQQWPAEMVRRIGAAGNLFAFGASEWSCEYGHVLVLGVDPLARYNGPIATMRKVVQERGGFMIFAHPFRYFPGPMSLLFGRWKDAGRFGPAALAEHPAFACVDALEVLNNGCTDRENELALAVSQALGKPGTGGSDAHSAAEVGRCATIFDEPLVDGDDLLIRLRSGRFRAARRAADGTFVPVEAAAGGIAP